MFLRRPLGWPISLAIVMIVVLVALTVGWILLAFWGAQYSDQFKGIYYTMLCVGSALFVLMVVGVVIYLVLTIKAINLNRRQSNFIDSVTHELKSPIASLKLYLQTLNIRSVPEEERAKFYSDMLEDVERLDDLINHMLAAARMERSAEDEQEPVDLSELLDGCIVIVCARYRVPLDTVQKELRPVTVLARRVDLELIFCNLIDNAIKYSGAPPEVMVRCHDDQAGAALVSVIDNGPGIPRKLRSKVFGRFVRLIPELERDKPGTGLGLYIVRTLVRRLRGRVRIKSPDTSAGTEFQVRLPLYVPTETPPDSA